MSFVFKKINEKRREASVSPPLRCCHLKKNDGEQYGFNLKSKNKDECHFIGKVDEKTPAAKSGLKAGDQIISINHNSVENFDYEKVIELIKKGLSENDNKHLPNELVLTVIEKKLDEFSGETIF